MKDCICKTVKFNGPRGVITLYSNLMHTSSGYPLQPDVCQRLVPYSSMTGSLMLFKFMDVSSSAWTW